MRTHPRLPPIPCGRSQITPLVRCGLPPAIWGLATLTGRNPRLGFALSSTSSTLFQGPVRAGPRMSSVL